MMWAIILTETKLPALKKYIKANILPCILLLILVVTVGLVVYYRLKLQLTIGPFWDTYAYLSNALEFAGIGTGYYELDRPPFLPFLTSLLFRIGFVSEVAIYIVDGLIFIFGVIGLYLLFNLRFNPLESFAGTTLYISFPLILSWLGLGYVDIAAVSFSIWAVYTTVLAVRKNPKFFYVAFPLAMMAFLTRFTAGFILFPIILYILIGGNYLKHFKHMLKGVLVSFLLIIPYMILIYQKTGDPFYSMVWSLTFRAESPKEHFGYTSDPFYYLEHLNSYISTQIISHDFIFYLIISIIIIGLLIYIYSLVKAKKGDSKINLSLLKRVTSFTKIKILLLIILLVGFLFTLGNISYMVSEFLFFILCYVAYDLLKDQEKFDLDILFFSWFMTQFISQSLFELKVDRYFITMTPALAYFIILGLNQITGKLKVNYQSINLTAIILPFIIIIVALSSTSLYLNNTIENQDNYMAPDFYENQILTANMDSAVEWLMNYDQSYQNKTIRAELWPGFVWKLKKNMSEQPNFNTTDALNHELEKNNIDYYISLTPNLNLKSYTTLKEFGNVTIYQKDPSKVENKPQMLYIGQGWQNYIDQVLGLKAYVQYEAQGRFTIGKATEIDSHSLEELQKYPYILLYNFKWHNQQKTEDLLMEYVKSGGTVVIDASGNLEGVYYNLDNAVFLNTSITKKSLPPNPNIEPKNQTNFSPFLSDGATWYGANYESTGNNKIEPLITANGNTLIGVQKIGNGKIIWIGYNLIWHAFHLGNQEEMELIQRSIGV